MNFLKGLYAKLNLALAFLMHVFFKRWISHKGANAFLSLYKEDNIFALTPKSRNQFVSHSNCINCGLCVVQCEVTDLQFYQTFITPAHMAFSYSRSLPEIPVNADFTHHCSSCRGCEKVCPTDVPLTDIIAFVKTFAHGHSRTPPARSAGSSGNPPPFENGSPG